jgi:hypothetical protein
MLTEAKNLLTSIQVERVLVAYEYDQMVNRKLPISELLLGFMESTNEEQS